MKAALTVLSKTQLLLISVLWTTGFMSVDTNINCFREFYHVSTTEHL